MYPHTYLSLFPAFPKTSKAFVAMSFGDEFTARWKHVLAPAIAEVPHNGATLQPFRVDLSKVSDAILVEILQAVADSAVIVADITATSLLNERAVRNANVLYEVGIAHASRRPEEVVLFRSDRYQLDFDVQGVRVHSYDPEGNPEGAHRQVRDTIVESLRSVDSARTVAVSFGASRMTPTALVLLQKAVEKGSVEEPSRRTMGDALSSVHVSRGIELLLELGALSATPLKVTHEMLDVLVKNPAFEIQMFRYTPTPFGRALLEHLAIQFAGMAPDVLSRLESMRSRDGAAAAAKGTNRGDKRARASADPKDRSS